MGLVTEKMTFPLLAAPAAEKISSTALYPSLASSNHKKTVGFYLWKTSSMALSLNGRTFGTPLVSTNVFKESAVKPASNPFLNSSKVLNKTTAPSEDPLAVPTSAEAAPKVISSYYPATPSKVL